ncbi:hypothetical protein TNIN_320881 [Trichonephila inaurata madagascariensis]|uniref:Uncharacterized protein n=1 Tax=Trichonephila inaurata madagascariensis TaxID=2747483 RepID=A0A8X6XE59_9ARAC|nr:hypothetical protein TNIN_320881 [Trichonephila inaurata madagascariensis]
MKKMKIGQQHDFRFGTNATSMCSLMILLREKHSPLHLIQRVETVGLGVSRLVRVSSPLCHPVTASPHWPRLHSLGLREAEKRELRFCLSLFRSFFHEGRRMVLIDGGSSSCQQTNERESWDS